MVFYSYISDFLLLVVAYAPLFRYTYFTISERRDIYWTSNKPGISGDEKMDSGKDSTSTNGNAGASTEKHKRRYRIS